MLTFRVGEQSFALATDRIKEVARMPRLSRVPHAPASLLGLANVRGAVLPVVSLARMLDQSDGLPKRMIVVEDGELYGLAVEETSQVVATGQLGAAQEINLASLIARALPIKVQRQSRPALITLQREAATQRDTVALIAFAIGNQEFAFPLTVVEEVLPVPPEIAVLPDADSVVIGFTSFRETVLPLLSLRALLGLPLGADQSGAHKRRRVLVVRIGFQRVGLLVDDIRSVLQVAEAWIDILPRALGRGNAEARIQAICRLDDGARLVSILAADQLLREDITASLLQGASMEQKDETPSASAATAAEQFLVFRIGEDEFGLPLASVEEVAPLPDRLTRLPKAPSFIKGLMNLRGQVIPVIDQAQRFGASPATAGRRRVIVVRLGELMAGFIVDAVSEVTTIEAADLAATPDLGNDQTKVFERVANLSDQHRIILIVSPRELLDRAEQDLLHSLAAHGAGTGP